MSFIAKEIPTGLINGINKTFLLLNPVDYITDIFVDGTIYTTFSLVGNQLTLADAPELSIYVDYYTGTGNPIVDTTIDFGFIKSEVWRLLGAKSSSTNFSSTIVWQEINSVIRKVWRGRVININSWGIVRGRVIPPTEYRAGKQWYTEGKTNFRIYQGWLLQNICNPWDTTISVDTTYLLPNGYVEIGWDTINYTWVGLDINWNPQLEWVTGITVQHLVAEYVTQLYLMPSDMDRPSNIWWICKDWRRVELPQDNTDTFWIYYQIVRNNITQLLKIVWIKNDNLINVCYSRKLYDLVNDSDICQIPDDYGRTVIAPLAAWGLAYEKNLPDGSAILKRGFDSLAEMYQFFTNEITIIKQKIKPIAYSNFRRW